MKRAFAERETKETIKLIAISFIAIILYLCLSFSPAYGYQISNLDRFNIKEVDSINWDSDTWLSYNLSFNSVNGNSGSWSNFEWPSQNLNDAGLDDGNEIMPSVPEPSIILLFGIGVGGFALFRKFRG